MSDWTPIPSLFEVCNCLRGSVEIAALLCRCQTAGGGSIPRRLKCRRPAERQRARTKKKGLYIWKHSMLEYWQPACFWVLAASVLLSTGSQRAFVESFPGVLMLAYVAGSVSTDFNIWQRIASPSVSQAVCHIQQLLRSNYCVSSLAAGFRFHSCSMCIPLPPEF